MSRIIVDGKDFTNYTDGFEDLKYSVGLNPSTKTVSYNVSSEFQFKGNAALYFKKRFFSDCNGREKISDVVLYLDDCQNEPLGFKITPEGISYCNGYDCTVTVRLQALTKENECYNYFDEHYWWESGFKEAFEHPRVWFCSQPGFMHYILLVLRQALLPVFVAVGLMVVVVSILCHAFNALPIPFVDDIPCPDLGDGFDLLVIYDEFLKGCGKYQPSPLLREILSYQAAQCGMTFQSSILNNSGSVYYNTAYFNLQDRGARKNDDINWIDENAPLETIIELLNKLSSLFNADYRIRDGLLIFERIDYFDNTKKQFVDLRVAETEDELCYSFNSEKLCAYGDFQYQQDGIETQGNRLLRSLYSDKVEWNNPPSDAQKGKCTVFTAFGGARFMYDTKSYEKEGFLDFDAAIDNFRDGGAGVTGLDRYQDLIIADEQAMLGKLLILEDGFDRKDAKTIRKKFGSRKLTNGVVFTSIIGFLLSGDRRDFYHYNYPMYFMENAPSEIGENELYNNFHYISNPRQNKRDYFELDDVTILLNCQRMTDITAHGVDMSIETDLGTAIAETFEIDKEACTIKIQGMKIKCK